MLEVVQAGGWLMVPILLCSVLAMAICIERALILRSDKVVSLDLLKTIRYASADGSDSESKWTDAAAGSLFSLILEAGLSNRQYGYEIAKEAIEEAGIRAIQKMERYLTTLGTIATIAPLLGLLGTVIGMIKVFTAVELAGTGDAQVFAGGISEALVTTATGLVVAIPALAFYRHFTRKVDELTVLLEAESSRLMAWLEASFDSAISRS